MLCVLGSMCDGLDGEAVHASGQGAGASQAMRKAAASVFKTAITIDANKTNVTLIHSPSALDARNGVEGSTTPSTDSYTYGSGYAIS